MGSKVEMSLDDIIAQSKKSRGGARGGRGRGARGASARGGVRRGAGGGGGGGAIRRGGGRGAARSTPYAKGNVESKWKHDLYEGSGGRTRSGGGSSGTGKLLVSNLDFGVSDKDIKELFSEFGPLDKAHVHYDRSGRSLGTADVVFLRRNDAVRAMRQYNGVPLDGRAMDISMAAGAEDLGSAKSRLGVTARGGTRGGTTRGARRGTSARGGSTRGGRGRGGARGGVRGGKREQLSVDELNKQLDEYLSQK